MISPAMYPIPATYLVTIFLVDTFTYREASEDDIPYIPTFLRIDARDEDAKSIRSVASIANGGEDEKLKSKNYRRKVQKI